MAKDNKTADDTIQDRDVAPTAPTQEDIDKAVFDATHDADGKPIPIVSPPPTAPLP